MHLHASWLIELYAAALLQQRHHWEQYKQIDKHKLGL